VDAAHLTQLFAVGAVAIAIMRYLLTTLDRAEAGFASLFVPPDRTLGWPRGVQESDAPWGWRPPLETIEADEPSGLADLDVPIERLVITHIGSYVEPTRLVEPVIFRTLPQ